MNAPQFAPTDAEMQALVRLVKIALVDTGQSRRVAEFLRASMDQDID